MKTLLRIPAVLAFLFPFIVGVLLLKVAMAATRQAGLIAGAMGAFLVCSAFLEPTSTS